MAAVYTWQFVDSIAATPGVRLDLSGPGWTVRPATSFGVPELRRVAVSTMLVDGDQYPAAAYGNRTLTLVVRVDGVSDDAIAAQKQQLYRELDRTSNILRYAPGTSVPVFFRTFRAGPNDVTWNPFTKEVTASVPAEPFALGLKETLSTVTVAANPTLTNGLYFDVSGVKGDVETPLFLQLSSTSAAGDPWQPVIAVRRRGTPSAMPMVLQAETGTRATDTTIIGTADPDMAVPYTRSDFSGLAGTAMGPRLTWSVWPSSPSVDNRGRYVVLARVRKSVANDPVQVQLTYAPSGSLPAYTNDAVTLRNITTPQYVDLGEVQLPIGYDPVTDGYSGVEVPVAGVWLSLMAARTSGTAVLDVDFLLWTPADDRRLITTWRDLGSSGASGYVIDSSRSQCYAVGSSGQIQPGTVTIEGSPPLVSPGVTNRIVMVRHTGQVGTGDVLSGTSGVTPYYWPRYLYVRGVST